MPTLTYKQAALRVLKDATEPLHPHEIARRALDAGLVQSSGKTPERTMEASLYVAARSKSSPIVLVAPRRFALREHAAAEAAPAAAHDGSDERRIKVPHFPTYTELRGFLKAVPGLRVADVTGFRSGLKDLRGTPQANLDWSDPDTWIPARLEGDMRATANAIWVGSGKVVNPRHMTGVWLLSRNYDLLEEDADGVLGLSPRGEQLLGDGAAEIERDVDEAEGLLAILQIVGENGPGNSTAFLDPWTDHLQQNSRVRSEPVVRGYLYNRLRNLLERGLVARSGQQYALTEGGLAWLGEGGFTDGPEADPSAELIALVKEKQDQVKEAIHAILLDMDPYAFEHLIRDLLVEMGYVDVRVTSASNDKGVDVVGEIALGITSVKEVIQVKRHRRTIQRKDLDALRGCLHRFQAVRGTIITTSRFSSGTQKAAFEPGAAPITLIDGEKLVELLAQHGVGVRKRKVEVWELDESAFEMGEEGADGE